MADSDIDDRALPDLHDYQLVRLVAGQNEAEAGEAKDQDASFKYTQ